jgi:hypothetical protein
MSAFLVSDRHITEMLRFASGAGRDHITTRVYHSGGVVMTLAMPDELEKAGQVLVNQNYKSMAALYGDEKYKESHKYKYEPVPFCDLLPAVQIIKLCDCYNYQASETGDYYQTLAYSIVRAIRDRVVECLPGYEAAEWSIN